LTRIADPVRVLLGENSVARVLITDDDGRLRQTLSDVLARAGHEVFTASTGRNALAVLGREAVDVIITDVYMPEMDGIELLLALRQTHTELPVVVISGGGTRGNVEVLDSLEMLGAACVLRKPFDFQHLLAVVDELTAGAHR
jgi:DNA-binding response OmpR family regulator